MIAETRSTVAEAPETRSNYDLSISDAVWIGMAVLQQASESDQPFNTGEIVATTDRLRLTNGQRNSIYLHVNQHCVANRPPQSNRSRMLFGTSGGKRRLFRDGDPYDPAREGAPTHPAWNKLPGEFEFLRNWYEEVWNGVTARGINDPLLSLIGSGAAIWKDEPADLYVANLRKNWGGV